MTELDLAKTSQQCRRMAIQETAAERQHVQNAQRFADLGQSRMAEESDAFASASDRRAHLWTQLADQIDAYFGERAVPDPRLL